MSREERTTMMLDLVEQWRESGMTQKDFAESHEVKLSTLRYWIRKSRDEMSSGSFIPLNLSAGQVIRLYYPNGMEIELPAQTPVRIIRDLINL